MTSINLISQEIDDLGDGLVERFRGARLMAFSVTHNRSLLRMITSFITHKLVRAETDVSDHNTSRDDLDPFRWMTFSGAGSWIPSRSNSAGRRTGGPSAVQ